MNEAPGVAAESEQAPSSLSFQTVATPGTTQDIRRVYPTTVIPAGSFHGLCHSCWNSADMILTGPHSTSTHYCRVHAAEWLAINLRNVLEVAYHVEAGLDSMEAEKQVRRLEDG